MLLMGPGQRHILQPCRERGLRLNPQPEKGNTSAIVRDRSRRLRRVIGTDSEAAGPSREERPNVLESRRLAKFEDRI